MSFANGFSTTPRPRACWPPYGPDLIPELAAAVAKLMSNKDLVLAASKVRVVTRCRNTMGERGVLGIRIQPNHPADDIGGILLSAADGLLYGCGDAVIGVNPAAESVEVTAAILSALDRLIEALAIPTQACCLAHITTQLACIERGAPVDLLFQSIAGTEAANASFGINLALLREGQERVLEHHRTRDVSWIGEQAMYFETGQGSALSAGAHHGVDQLTTRGPSLRRRPVIRPVSGQQRGRLHWAGVSLRRAADHPRRVGRSFHGQAAGPAHGS